jgi:hypothetical protein
MPDRRFSLAIFSRSLFVAVGILAAAACSGNGANPPQTIPPTAAPGAGGTPAPTATPIPNSVATSVPLSINTSGPAISAPLPAPAGYTSHLTVPIASGPAGTTFQLTSSATLPGVLPILQSKTRVATSVRIPQAASNFLPIFFTSIVPSASVTIAGNISTSQVFPVGILSTANTYYLGFYDSTQTTPAWQTINGPVTTTDGKTLTFTGDIKSFTLQANQLYGFAIFSLASAAVTPPPAPQTVAYLANGAGGIDKYTETGTKLGTLPISANTFGMDDSGTIYASVVPTSAPTSVAVIQKIPFGAASPSATLAPSANASGSCCLIIDGVSGSGAVGVLYLTSASEGFDVWNSGLTGAPSFSILPTGISAINGIMGHDGTIYIQNITAGGTSQISVYSPGSSTPSRTIPEQLVPLAQQATFAANYEAVGPDGTLYVTEYSFVQPDPLAGLYIYHPDGTETFALTTGATGGAPGSVTGNPGLFGVDVDAAGNIYVAANNAGFDGVTGAPLTDTLNDVEVFAPGATRVLRHIAGTMSPITVVAASDGTAFVSGFGLLPGQPMATWIAQPGASTVTQINSVAVGSIYLFDGSRATSGVVRTQSLGSGGSHGITGNLQARIAAVLAKRRH